MYLKSRLALRQGVHGNPGDTVLTTVQLHHQVFQTEAKLGKLHKIQKARKTDVSFYGPYTFQGFYPHHSNRIGPYFWDPCSWTVASEHSHHYLINAHNCNLEICCTLSSSSGRGIRTPDLKVISLIIRYHIPNGDLGITRLDYLLNLFRLLLLNHQIVKRLLYEQLQRVYHIHIYGILDFYGIQNI